ncbi:MAG: hypothetical protein A2591_00030 [Candidatus Yonathbacteria bacterium RIFOXYD1_FULL_52_36]|uniref:DUF5673 domain-containing protein n=1 Tax=Candidatus Yonathbacteria bacterium RIFOXYD1_FULL_52_36 TaxID=1802730 RepID=A0A1G2SLK7_9BACT|nr:MAG: hypothetical protein A2591_00030 [Candidatus Yonathbacteria bacterium RIFOXYD1_FULL_52_36]
MQPRDVLIEWKTPAYEYRPKTADWYWALCIIAISGAIAAFFFENYLFSALILIGAFTLALYGSKQPPIVTVAIRERGINIDHTLYPFLSLKSFWVTDGPQPKLMLISRQTLVPYIITPLCDEVNPESVRELLLEFLEEEKMVEPFPHRLMDRLGF